MRKVVVLCCALSMAAGMYLCRDVLCDWVHPTVERVSYGAEVPDAPTSKDAPSLLWETVNSTSPDAEPVACVLSLPSQQPPHIYCDGDGNPIPATVISTIQANRNGYHHTGEDIVPTDGWLAYDEVYAVCPFSGTVTSVGYDYSNARSMGYNVVVQVTPHVDIIYMHLAYGSGRAIQYSHYTSPETLTSVFPFQDVGYPEQWTKVGERWVGPSSIAVREGVVIPANTVIGVPGNTGNSTGLHAHFTLRYNGARTYYACISEAINGTPLKDLTWYYFSGDNIYSTTAEEAGFDLDELDVRAGE